MMKSILITARALAAAEQPPAAMMSGQCGEAKKSAGLHMAMLEAARKPAAKAAVDAAETQYLDAWKHADVMLTWTICRSG